MKPIGVTLLALLAAAGMLQQPRMNRAERRRSAALARRARKGRRR